MGIFTTFLYSVKSLFCTYNMVQYPLRIFCSVLSMIGIVRFRVFFLALRPALFAHILHIYCFLCGVLLFELYSVSKFFHSLHLGQRFLPSLITTRLLI